MVRIKMTYPGCHASPIAHALGQSQSVGLDAPEGQKKRAGQSVGAETLPLQKEPAGHGVTAPSAQKAPAGHGVSAVDAAAVGVDNADAAALAQKRSRNARAQLRGAIKKGAALMQLKKKRLQISHRDST